MYHKVGLLRSKFILQSLSSIKTVYYETELTINKTVLSKLKILKYWIAKVKYTLEGRTALGLCRCGLSSNKPFVMVHTVGFEHECQLTCRHENKLI
jgi:CDGSH-type Zn-finger protein